MLIRVPDYYMDIRCLAGACPHSCCTQWEVVIDEKSAAHYRTLAGPLGDKLRRALQPDADGDLCFALNGGRCPFLDEENLCEIHRQLGEDATSITCREHPRFTEDYGPFREVTLAVSCPAANTLLLSSTTPLRFLESETEDPTEAGDPWLEFLLPLRQRMLDILTDRSIPFKKRLQNFLLLATDAQCCLDEELPQEIPGLLLDWTPATIDCQDTPPLFPSGLQLLTELEELESDWHTVVQQAISASSGLVSESLLERIASYFAFRYLLKAVNDGDLLGRAQFVIYAVLVIHRLASVCGLHESLRRFSCEIEHNEEHLDALLDAFRWQESMSVCSLLRQLTE